MADINQVVLVGRLTRDVELKYTNTGFAIANLSLAVNRRVKKDDTWQDEGNFFNCVLIGKRAEALAQYLVKGKQIGIQGELRQNRWEQDGQPRSRVEIFVNDIQLLGGRSAEQGSAVAPDRQAQYSAPEIPTADDFDDDIPF
ncbi:MAG: single-stranded DNA-binding protein [Spirochaetaceae bacterium]|nr:MAG: single-stranded DNA-binding protein [Spirochaetaceae bacterium]